MDENNVTPQHLSTTNHRLEHGQMLILLLNEIFSVVRQLHWLGHAARRPDGELIKDLFCSHHFPSCKPDEGADNHDQGRPGLPLRIASLWPRTIEKGLCESL